MIKIRTMAEGLLWGLAAFLLIEEVIDISMIASWFMP